MTLKDAIVKVVLKRDDASFNEVKKKFEEIENKKNKLKEEIKIGVNLSNAGIAITNLQRVQAELQKIKNLNKSIGKVSLDDGRTAYINKYGDIGFNRNNIVSNAINERKMRELDAINRKASKTTKSNEHLVNKMSMTGEIMRGALMTVGYQFVNLMETGARKIVDASNKTLRIQSQMGTLTNDKNSQKAFESDIYRIANTSYANANDVSDLFTKIGQNAKYLGYNGGDISKMTQTVFDAFSIGAVGAQQQQGAIIQLTQTIAKGKNKALWQDIKFLEEDAPELANLIAEGLGLKNGLGDLKKVIAEGKITGKQIGDALIKMSEKEREKFIKSNKIRPEQAITYFNNKFKKAVSDNSEAFSKIAKGLMKITDKIFTKEGIFNKIVKDVGNFFNNLDVDKFADRIEHSLNLLGKLYDILGGIKGIMIELGALVVFSKIASAIMGMNIQATTFKGILLEILSKVALLSKKFIVATAIVVAIIGALLVIQDLWQTITDPEADTIFRRVYDYIVGIADKIKEMLGLTDGAKHINDANNIPDTSLLGRITSALPENMRGGFTGLTFNVNQVFNGNIDDKTAENYKQASKDMADMTENRYSELNLAEYY